MLQAKVQLSDAEITLSRTVLRAPEAGQVIKIDAKRGPLVLPGTTAIYFLPADTILHVEVQVDESDVGKIKSGQNALVTPTGSDKRFDASVQNIVPLVDASRGTATVNLGVSGEDDAFLPDLSALSNVNKVMVLP